MDRPALSRNVTVTIATAERLDVREFVVDERLSGLFEIDVVAVSGSADVDFEGAVGAPARFAVHAGEGRTWTGVVARVEQTAVDEEGLCTYALRIVPALWLLGHRRNYRIFQDESELDVALRVLREWGTEPLLELDPARYPKRRLRTQYGESDLVFVSRLLEDIGVAYQFEEVGGETRLVLVDAPNRREVSARLPFVDKPNERLDHKLYVTDLRARRELRPGRLTQSDVDYRRPLDYPLAASSVMGNAVESRLERYQLDYGSFLWKGPGGDTPHADDRGAARTNEREGAVQVRRRLEALRGDGRVTGFVSSDLSLRPGRVLQVTGHPREEVAAPLLISACRLQGKGWGEWVLRCEARPAEVPYRPPLVTPRPRTNGVESATVTGPFLEQIHTDEFGRVRVHFHWDREGRADETSSCWIPVNQPWAGAGFGAVNIPRVGQEVLVDFLGADPDRPVVVGRVFTTTTPPPYKLPDLKMVGGMRSDSYPRAVPAPAPRMGGGPAVPELLRRPLEDEGGGGGGGGGGAAPGDSITTPMPGLFGGNTAAQEDFDAMVSEMQSSGPDPNEHGLPANAVTTDDTAGAEKLYLQGQKDVRLAAKNNLTGSVGGNRAFAVHGNDYEGVNGYQVTRVVQDRTVAVTSGNQTHAVQKDVVCQTFGNHVTQVKHDLVCMTELGGQVYGAKQGFTATVNGTATILMTPTAIVIDARHVYINPGAKVMADILAGMTPEDAVAKAEEQAKIDNAAAEMASELRDKDEELSFGESFGQSYYDALELVASGQVTAENGGQNDDGSFIGGDAENAITASGLAQQLANDGLTPEQAKDAARQAITNISDNLPKGQE